MTTRRDVVIIGGGHNGLAAAAYLARAGLDVEVLERLDTVGGAAVSAEAFAGIDARLSRYSYLVSLLPKRIIDDLGLSIRLAPRRYSSYTPVPGGEGGLLVDNHDSAATDASFAAIGAKYDADAWRTFYDGTTRLARTLFPTVTDPLLTRSEARAALGDDALWDALIEQPVGRTIERTFASDLVRGVAYTDALIGTFASNDDETLAANRCFLYHVIGGGTGDWNVPVGGMGAVTGELARAARLAGATLTTGAEVTALDGDRVVSYRVGDAEHRVAAERVLVNASPRELNRLLAAGDANGASTASRVHEPAAEGAQVKVNLLLTRLPRLKDASIDPAAAFGGTFHINELFSQLQSAYDQASAGRVPDPVPAEIYCHSLTDPTILGPDLQAAGAHTLTVFALHTPDRLLSKDTNDRMRDQLQHSVIDSLNSVLAEPIESLLMTDGNGNPCVETKTTRDLEQSLRLPGGNIFHGDLAWPWLEDGDAAGAQTPAERWGVATGVDGVYLCGSGARRGGAVSAIGGQNAAMAVLEERGGAW
ncbi:phytoene dehydrogenase-like protein [Microcella putealis]|uniref:Phytoene dehydrogenase-like protein n=1 Tax=Microcella putealis TaxID=337005 RepID=A0A4V2EWK5_9MICO|nr:NAD(P)/FAD-dependent oxidoreductase [Microcella putealis]RZS56310.1 phytoene dehydrogenase-like protein [Microcella putealis]TQM27204.1 phytoene dehydrogenase-like protein [Microcella putealis]